MIILGPSMVYVRRLALRKVGDRAGQPAACRLSWAAPLPALLRGITGFARLSCEHECCQFIGGAIRCDVLALSVWQDMTF
jgi:hypothetical protein